MTLGRCIIVTACCIAVACLNSCYHTKCKDQRGSYFDCDHRENECKTDFRTGEVTCSDIGSASFGGHVSCFSWEECKYDSYTGQAECEDPESTTTRHRGTRNRLPDKKRKKHPNGKTGGMDIDTDKLGKVVLTIFIVFVVVIVAIIVTCCICCFFLGRGCFRHRNRNRGVVVVQQPVAYNQPTGNIQTAYPSVQVHPPAQYPPSGGTYPTQIPAGSQSPYPPRADSKPPPYEAANQPAQNTYM